LHKVNFISTSRKKRRRSVFCDWLLVSIIWVDCLVVLLL